MIDKYDIDRKLKDRERKMAETKAAKRTTKNKTDEKIMYLVNALNESFIIEIPISWKVEYYGNCLRILKGKELRAAFSEITRFRDLSISYKRM